MQLGIIVDNIVNNSYYYSMFKNLNILSDMGMQCYVFANSTVELPIENRFAILQQIEAFHHSDILVATSLINAQAMRKNLMAKKKYYYVWYPEWTNLTSFYYTSLELLYMNDSIELISRSQSHAELLESLFKKPYMNIINWDYNGLWSLTHEHI